VHILRQDRQENQYYYFLDNPSPKENIEQFCFKLEIHIKKSDSARTHKVMLFLRNISRKAAASRKILSNLFVPD